MNHRLILTALLIGSANASVLYDESVSEQLNTGVVSDDYTQLLSPSELGDLSEGDNSVFGTINFGDVNASDFFQFTVPKGHQLLHFFIDHMSYAFDSNGSERFQLHFLSMDAGDSLSYVQSGNTSLFATLIEAAEVEIALGEVGSYDALAVYQSGGLYGAGLTTPLSAGSYNVLFQETSGTAIDYEFRFVTAKVPEPSTALLVVLGVFSFAAQRSRAK